MRLFLKKSGKFTAKERHKLLFSKKRVIDLDDYHEEKETEKSLTTKKILKN